MIDYSDQELSLLIPHHTYCGEPPGSPWELVRAVPCPPGHVGFEQDMAVCGEALRAAGVGAVVLVHGTFVGHDPLGLLGELGRIAPAFESGLRSWSKALVDFVMRETGNYSAGFARRMEAGVNGNAGARIPVHRFCWSGENHHLARCEAALGLIEYLHQRDLPAGRRILLWAHSHGGNVCALASWLLSAGPEELNCLLDAARIHYRSPFFKRLDRPLWERVRDLLLRRPGPLSDHPLDVVTFGMPLRHRWTSSDSSRLMHVVHHRPSGGLPAWRARWPWNPLRVLTAADGDYVQQLGIAGTNFAPPWPLWRALRADWRLNRLLQGDVGASRLWARLKTGQRVAGDGLTLLVDYGHLGPNVVGHLLGHGVYTRSRWMVWHLQEIVRRWYREQSADPAALAATTAGT